MKFYHGMNEYGLAETIRQGYLLHSRATPECPGISPCTYLAVDKGEAMRYGDIVVEVDYDPTQNPGENNYCDGCWQCRVYEPIYKWKIIEENK